MNLDDKIIIDDDVEVKYQQQTSNEEKQNNNNNDNYRNVYTNNNINKVNYFSLAFSKKYIALTFSTISILLVLFMKFIGLCGVRSLAFFGIWFLLSASLAGVALVLNIINFAKNKKIDFNVSSIISFLAILALLLV